MNERIRELIQEADRKCSETRGVFDEILVQLVVRECYVQVTKYPNIGTSLAGKMMIEYFGVKDDVHGSQNEREALQSP